MTASALAIPNARDERTAFEAHEERTGVCRDYAHLAITLCRCMNIPARYCTGYLGDIGVPPVPAPMDLVPGLKFYGRPLVDLGRSAQSTPHWPYCHGARPGCGRCRDQHRFRKCHTERVQGHHRALTVPARHTGGEFWREGKCSWRNGKTDM